MIFVRDYPNGWAPIQHMIVEGLARSGSNEAKTLAKDMAMRWIRTNYAAYKKMGVMHEKYDVRSCGAYGGGGEYVPQVRENLISFRTFMIFNHVFKQCEFGPDWLWVVEWSCFGVLGRVWVASRP